MIAMKLLIKRGYVHALSLLQNHPYNFTHFFKSVTYFQPYEKGDKFKYTLFKSINYSLQWGHFMRIFMNQKICTEMGSLLLHGTLFSNTVEETEVRTFFTQNLLWSFPVSCANDVTEFNAIYRKQRQLPLAKFQKIWLTCLWVAKIFVRSHIALCYSGHWFLQIILALFNKYISIRLNSCNLFIIWVNGQGIINKLVHYLLKLDNKY
jgi:hypothetical protein